MIDYHVHTERSGDATGSIMRACVAAYLAGLSEICFTEHLDFEPTDECYGAFDYELYTSQVAEAREAFGGRLAICCGVEVDFQEKHRSQIEDFLGGHEFDYVLGAAHYVDGVILEDHERYFPGKTAAEAYTPYFENVIAAIETGWFDTIAHIDLCKRYGVRYFGRFDHSKHQDQILHALNAVIRRGMALEINTSGLRQSPGEPYPCEGILEHYYALGGRQITFGSDSHRPEDIGAGIADAMRVASDIGLPMPVRLGRARRLAGTVRTHGPDNG